MSVARWIRILLLCAAAVAAGCGGDAPWEDRGVLRDIQTGPREGETASRAAPAEGAAKAGPVARDGASGDAGESER